MSLFSKIFGGNKESIPTGLAPTSNPALEYIRSIPQNQITKTLIEALPNLSLLLLTESRDFAKRLGMKSVLLSECILDLELLSVFNKALEFTQDKALASACVDAIIFEATGREPSGVPGREQFEFGGTENYRGIAKYVMAPDYFKVPSPNAWLFGKEYSRIKTGSALDIAHIAGVRAFVTRILETGALAFEIIEELGAIRPSRPQSGLTLEEAMRSIDPDKANAFCLKWMNNVRSKE
jgi:hypothetical protein